MFLLITLAEDELAAFAAPTFNSPLKIGPNS